MSMLAKMIVLLLCLGLAMLAQENRHTSNVPIQPHGRVTQMITPSRMPHSIEDLVQTSDLVIDGYVETTEKARIRNPDYPTSLETDAIIRVDKVIAGQAPAAARIVVSETGGKLGDLEVVTPQNVLMQSKERYILALIRDDRQNLPSVSGLPRYCIRAVWAGKFKVDEQGKIHPSSETGAAMKMHDNEAVDAFAEELAQAAKRRSATQQSK